MQKYIFGGAAVILVAVLAIFFWPKPAPADPLAARTATLIDAAQKLCLAGSDTTKTATIATQLAVAKGVSATGSAVSHEQVVAGAMDLPDAIRAVPDTEIRTCLTPYGEQVRALAAAG